MKMKITRHFYADQKNNTFTRLHTQKDTNHAAKTNLSDGVRQAEVSRVTGTWGQHHEVRVGLLPLAHAAKIRPQRVSSADGTNLKEKTKRSRGTSWLIDRSIDLIWLSNFTNEHPSLMAANSGRGTTMYSSLWGKGWRGGGGGACMIPHFRGDT